jgi:hypothetical protein
VLSRRLFLNLCIAFGGIAPRSNASASGPGGLQWIELPVPGRRPSSRRALVLYPAAAEPGQRFPGLLLFHGRGEARDSSVAIHAWRTHYGLEDSFARLSRPPLNLSDEQRRYIEPAQLAAIHQKLEQRPFSGFVLICPVTPNPHRSRTPALVLDRYSEWIEHTLLPLAAAKAPLDPSRGIGIDGCSMGGYVAAEVFARKPHLFRSFGVVQPAVGAFRVARYARELARALHEQTLRGIHLQTSTRDPYRRAVKAWAGHLERQGARFTLDVLPGPHDQEWLRATGTLAMLAWHDYILG